MSHMPLPWTKEIMGYAQLEIFIPIKAKMGNNSKFMDDAPM